MGAVVERLAKVHHHIVVLGALGQWLRLDFSLRMLRVEPLKSHVAVTAFGPSTFDSFLRSTIASINESTSSLRRAQSSQASYRLECKVSNSYSRFLQRFYEDPTSALNWSMIACSSFARYSTTATTSWLAPNFSSLLAVRSTAILSCWSQTIQLMSWTRSTRMLTKCCCASSGSRPRHLVALPQVHDLASVGMLLNHRDDNLHGGGRVCDIMVSEQASKLNKQAKRIRNLAMVKYHGESSKMGQAGPLPQAAASGCKCKPAHKPDLCLENLSREGRRRLRGNRRGFITNPDIGWHLTYPKDGTAHHDALGSASSEKLCRSCIAR
ncbi:hypothetical protein B296_00043949 [Ensete ventricosum]|uniref:Uncharacterized protein n=1 Tax=Ensete ventricosum TaxID=4639 RepID=A0A426ZCQ7_ENSVE|nr:hypothetical protein B296_00043949 [Ensete ventricosum]